MGVDPARGVGRTGCQSRVSCAKRDFGLNRTRIDGLHGAGTRGGHGILNDKFVKFAGRRE
jgi:hypothetical protein